MGLPIYHVMILIGFGVIFNQQLNLMLTFDILRIYQLWQNCRYETGIATFSGFQMFEYVGVIWIRTFNLDQIAAAQPNTQTVPVKHRCHFEMVRSMRE